MSNLSQDQLASCKRQLIDRQSQLIRQVQDRFGLEFAQTDSIGELSSYDNHPGDLGTELFERGKDLALNDLAEKELEDINKALHAIDEGTYGICRVCSMDIPFERIEALPTADTCMEHAGKITVDMSKRPIEEEVYSSHINPDIATPETQVGYDAEDAWQELGRYGSSDTPSDIYGDVTNPNDAYPNSDEDIGYVEDVERYPDTPQE